MHRRRVVRSRVAGAVILAAVAVAACGATEFPTGLHGAKSAGAVGPFVFDPNNPTKGDTHWHAALGVYDCDHWMGDSTGTGIWNWPTATGQGSPARASDPTLYAGLHSHDDGVIHMEPLVSEEAGKNATLGRYFDYGGWSLSSTSFAFLGRSRSTGDPCGGTPGRIEWEVAKWDGTVGPQKYTVPSGDPASYKLFNGDIVVIAFLPRNVTITAIGNPPSVVHLAAALGVPIVPPVGA